MRHEKGGPLGLGLAGCGQFGAFCLEAVADLEEVTPVAVTDIQADRAASLAASHGARALPNVDALLADPGVEVVIVATPPLDHGRIARDALEAGKHVFCEKPLATELSEAVAAHDASKRHERQLTVDYVMRWNPLYWLLHRLQQLRRADDSPLLGPLRRFALENLASDEGLPPDHWFWDRRVSGGIFVEHGVHFFDAAAWLLGNGPVAVHALQVERPGGAVDTVIASALHPGGATASYHHAFTHAHGAEYQSILLDWGFAHGQLRGWIPVELELEAWTDPEGAALLGALLADPVAAMRVPHVRPSGQERIDVEIAEVANTGMWRGRGEERQVSRRARVQVTLGAEAAKLPVYRESVRAGLADLVEAARAGRAPKVGGIDACESLATALAAQRAADSGRAEEPEQLELRRFE